MAKTSDKLHDLISNVKKLKINIACVSEMKNFDPEGEMFSFLFIEEHMFILAESTGILLDPMCRIAFQNGGSVVRMGSADQTTVSHGSPWVQFFSQQEWQQR